jgi:alpha-galactosidase
MRFKSVMEIAEINNKAGADAGNGYWNDPDMMVTGKQGLSEHEQESHFALWSIMSSPLFLGNNPCSMSSFEKNLIMNKEMIVINQDPTEQGRIILRDGQTQIWAKKLQTGKVAVFFLNLNKSGNKELSLNLDELGFKGQVNVRDVLHQKEIGVLSNKITQLLETNQCSFLELSPL